MKDNLRLYDLRQKLEETYGWPMSNLIFTWVHDKQIMRMLDCQMSIKEFNNLQGGVCLTYEIPDNLNAQLPSI